MVKNVRKSAKSIKKNDIWLVYEQIMGYLCTRIKTKNRVDP